MKKSIFFWSFIFWVSLCFSQPNIEWSKNYGGSSWESVKDMKITSDGNYIVLGFSGSSDGDVGGNNGESDIWLMKIDTLGVLLWSYNYGGSDEESPSAIIETNDGGFIVIGYSESNDGDVGNNYGGKDMWIFKVSDMGELLWSQNYGGSGFDSATSIIEDDDNNSYWVVGESDSEDGDIGETKGGRDIWLIKINELGDLIFEKNYGGSGYEGEAKILNTSDGGLILVGISGSLDGDIGSNIGGTDLWLVKLSNTGDIEWEKNHGGTSIELNASIVLTENGYVLFGSSFIENGTNGEGYDFIAIKTDELGSTLWTKNYGGTGNDSFNAAIPTLDGGFVLTGQVSSNDGDITNYYGSWDTWVLKITNIGDIIWSKNYGGSDSDGSAVVFENEDGSLLVGGASSSDDFDLMMNYGDSDAWIFKLAPFTTSTTNALIRDNTIFDIYPNPSDGTITIELEDQVGSGMIELINPLGVLMLKERFINSSIQIHDLSSGTYWLRYTNEGVVGVRLLIVE